MEVGKSYLGDYFRVARYPGLIPVGSQKLSSHYEFLATTIRITAD